MAMQCVGKLRPRLASSARVAARHRHRCTDTNAPSLQMAPLQGRSVTAIAKNIGASRRLHKHLSQRTMACFVGTEALDAAATEVDRFWERAYYRDDGPSRDEPVHTTAWAPAHQPQAATQVHRKSAAEVDEFFEHFRPYHYSNAGQEMNAHAVAALVSLMNLSSSDRFIDLGSSEGARRLRGDCAEVRGDFEEIVRTLR